MYGNKKKKPYSKKGKGTVLIKVYSYFKGGGKVKKEFRDSFLKKITFCSKHFDLNDDTHDVKEKVNARFKLFDY